MHCNLWSKGLSGALVSWQPITAIQILAPRHRLERSRTFLLKDPKDHHLHVFLRLELLFPQIGLVWHFSEKEGGCLGDVADVEIIDAWVVHQWKHQFFRQGWSFDAYTAYTAYTAYAWVFLW